MVNFNEVGFKFGLFEYKTKSLSQALGFAEE